MINRDLHSDDLNWIAFRYIADELSRDEAAAFEIRLADDQDARDAVVRAVQLAGAVAAAIPESSRPTVNRGAKSLVAPIRRRWVIATMALCCLVLVGVTAFRTRLAAPMPETSVAGSDQVRGPVIDLNEVWASTLVSLWSSADSSGLPDNDEPQGDDANDGDYAEMELADVGPSRDLTVPDWLILAVSNDDGLSSPGDVEETKEL